MSGTKTGNAALIILVENPSSPDAVYTERLLTKDVISFFVEDVYFRFGIPPKLLHIKDDVNFDNHERIGPS